MKEYKKPIIEDENLELEDIIAASSTDDGETLKAAQLWFKG